MMFKRKKKKKLPVHLSTSTLLLPLMLLLFLHFLFLFLPVSIVEDYFSLLKIFVSQLPNSCTSLYMLLCHTMQGIQPRSGLNVI